MEFIFNPALSISGFVVGLLVGLTSIAIGSHLVSKVSERGLRSLLAAILLLMGGKLIIA